MNFNLFSTNNFSLKEKYSTKDVYKITGSNISVSLGWAPHANPEEEQNEVDLDLFLLMLDNTPKLPFYDYLVFHSNLHSPDGAVEHSGDDREGKIEGDCECISIQLDKIDSNIKNLALFLTVHEDLLNLSTLAEYKNVFLRIFATDTGEEFYKETQIEHKYPKERTFQFGILHAINENKWVFVKQHLSIVGGIEKAVEFYI